MMLRISAILFALSGPMAHAACSDDVVTVIGDFGQARFTVTVADDNQERGRGLMFVEEMATLEGMLFVYEQPQRATFWMRNTLIGLDMIFTAADGEILKIHENAIPHDETVIDGGEGVQYVLEVNGGLTGRLGMKAGDVLQHPALGPNSRAPCE